MICLITFAVTSFAEDDKYHIVGLYQKSEKLSAFIPHCGPGIYYLKKRGSFFVKASPEIQKQLGNGGLFAIRGVLLKEEKYGYDGIIQINEVLEKQDFSTPGWKYGC